MTQQHIDIMNPTAAAPAAQAQETPQVVYASITERFVAFLIDYGIIFIPCQVLTWLVIKLMHPEIEMWHYLLWVAGVNGLFVLYESVFSCGDRMTLGKSLVGIAVVQQDLSGPISFGRALLRAVGYYISGALLMCGFLLAFFDDRHRSLHDMFGGSVVVQIRQRSGLERTLVQVLGGILLVAFAWTVYSQTFGGGAVLDQYYIRHARTHLYKISALEEVHKLKYGYYTNDLLRLSLLSGDPVQFQRDTRRALEPRGFKIGVSKTSYKISAVAKDTKHTRVVYAPEP
ncbi:MAG: RDD family protein [Elusimicrobiaceae bacterium]|nr:RDD family protein [Elusimicrobiaceae bacterium]